MPQITVLETHSFLQAFQNVVEHHLSPFVARDVFLLFRT